MFDKIKRLVLVSPMLACALLLHSCSSTSECVSPHSTVDEHLDPETRFMTLVDNNHRINFINSGNTTLSAENKQYLDRIAEAFHQLPPELKESIVFTIHANTSAEGSKARNATVGSHRAANVRNYLIQQKEIDASQFEDSRILPIHNETYQLDTAKAPAKDNRVAIVVAKCVKTTE